MCRAFVARIRRAVQELTGDGTARIPPVAPSRRSMSSAMMLSPSRCPRARACGAGAARRLWPIAAKPRHQLEGTHQQRLGAIEVALLEADDAQHVQGVERQRCARDDLFVQRGRARRAVAAFCAASASCMIAPERRLLGVGEAFPAGVRCRGRAACAVPSVEPRAAAVLEAQAAAAGAERVALGWRRCGLGAARPSITRPARGTTSCRSSSPRAATWGASRSRPRCRTTTATTPSGRTPTFSSSVHSRTCQALSWSSRRLVYSRNEPSARRPPPYSGQ